MRKTKLEKLADKLNEEFRSLLPAEMLKRFNIETETYFNIFAMELITTRKDGTDFTPEQMQYLAGYSEGYAAAMKIVKATP